MLTRRILAILTVGLCLSLGVAQVILAQSEQPTANELYQQGLDKYEAGDLEAARDLFRQVDTMQLPKEERVSLYKTLQAIDKQLAGGDPAEAVEVEAPAAEEAATETSPEVAEVSEAVEPAAEAAVAEAPEAAPVVEPVVTAADRLSQADDVATSNPSAAIELYESILSDAEASDSIKAVAGARLAHTRRLAKADEMAAKQVIDAAQGDLEAGQYASARSKLDAVADSGVQLDWFDQKRVADYTAKLEAHDAAMAAAAAEAEAVAMAEEEAAAVEAPATTSEPVATQVAVAEVEDGDAAAVEVETAEVEEVAQAQADAPAEAEATDDQFESYRLLYAQQTFAEGQQAEADGNLALAVEHYQDAVALDPENAEYSNTLSAAKARRNQQLAPANVLDKTEGLRGLRAEAARTEFRAAVNNANRLASAKSFPSALESAAQAKSIAERNSQLFSAAELSSLRSEADGLTNNILSQQRAYDQARLEAIAKEQKQQTSDAEKTASRERKEQINNLLLRARELQKDMKYAEALDVLDQVLWLDPNNIPAQAMKEMSEDAAELVRGRELRRDQRLYRTRLQNDDLEATVPYTEIIRYPSDWPQITETRLNNLDDNAGDSEINRQTLRKLTEPVPINFEANRLANVIEYLRNTTDVNFFVNWTALEQAGVEAESPISLQLKNVPAEQALRLVLQQVGSEFDPVGFSIIDGIVTISTQRDLQKTTAIRTYDIRDLLVQVPNFSNAPSFSLTDALSNTNSGGGGGGGGGGESNLFGDSDDDEDEEEDLPSRSEMIEQITTLIQDTIGNPDEWQAYGGDVSSIRELNGQFIIKSTPQNHREISKLLSDLRETRAVQIAVESRFLLVEENFLEEIGVDFDFQINDVGGGFGPISVAQDSVSNAVAPETDLTEFTPDDGIGGIGTFVPGAGFAPSGRSLDFGISYLDDFEASLLVKATQHNERSIALTAPRVTFFNGQRAYVTVARQFAFISDLEPVPDTGGFDITTSVISSGVVLDVEGTVSADRRYVTLTLRPSLADIQDIERIPIFSASIITDGGDIIPGTSAFIELPELEITEVRATVSVPDQGTMLLGGQRLVGEAEVEDGVPVLSKMPVLNRLFTNSAMVKDERTLLILIRPQIIIQGEEEEKVFPGITSNQMDYNANR